jgi:hypothetical protein
MAKLLKKVMLDEDYEDGTTMWRVPCDCHDPAHDARLWFEVDEHGFASLRISTEVGFYRTSFLRNLRRRFDAAFKMLFVGYYTMEGEVCLTHDGINGLRYALDEGQKKLYKAEEEYARKRKEQESADTNAA